MSQLYFSSLQLLDRLEDMLWSGTKSFDYLIKANQLGPGLINIYLLQVYLCCNVFLCESVSDFLEASHRESTPRFPII